MIGRAALIVLALAAVAAAADEAPISTQSALPAGVWAIVDSHTITKEDVVKKTKNLPSFVPKDQGESIVLDELIDEIILGEGLDRDGVGPSSVSEGEIEKFVDEVRTNAKRMGDELDAQLAKQGVTLDELKTKIRIQLAFKKRIENDATEDALRAWFAKHELEVAGEVRATQILIAPRGDDTVTFQRAIAVLAQVKPDGSNVGALARARSDDANAPLDSGDLDFFGSGSGVAPPEVVAACFELGKKGLVPRPVRSREGYHVIYVTDTRFTEPPSFEKHKENVRQRFLYEHAQELRKAWRAAAHLELAPDAPKIAR